MFQELLKAMALVLVVEGMLPFIRPERWRNMMIALVGQSDQILRIMGLISMLLGVAVLYSVH